jgi:hypothetical protein
VEGDAGDVGHEQSGEGDFQLSAHRAGDETLADVKVGHFDDTKLPRFAGW